MNAPLNNSLKSAIRLAIRHGNSIADVNLARWSETYGNCGPEHIRLTWESIQSEMSLSPVNQYEEEE